MASEVEPRERGRALIIIGWVLVFFALATLVMMFAEPAAARRGQLRFEELTVGLFIFGLLLSFYGHWLKGRNK